MADNVTNYKLYRGKCKEMCDEWLLKYPELKLTRGYYMCPMWGKQEHWWLVDDEGGIIDPSVKQFPTGGVGAEYIEYDGTLECENCGKTFMEGDKDSDFMGRYPVCSSRCALELVGL